MSREAIEPGPLAIEAARHVMNATNATSEAHNAKAIQHALDTQLDEIVAAAPAKIAEEMHRRRLVLAPSVERLDVIRQIVRSHVRAAAGKLLL